MGDIKRLFHAGVPQPAGCDDLVPRRFDDEVILRVVDKFLMQLEAQLHEKKVEAHFSDELKAWLAEKGLRSADGRAPDGPPDPGHHPLGTGRRVAVRAARQWRQVTIDLDEDDKVKLVFEETEAATA